MSIKLIHILVNKYKVGSYYCVLPPFSGNLQDVQNENFLHNEFRVTLHNLIIF